MKCPQNLCKSRHLTNWLKVEAHLWIYCLINHGSLSQEEIISFEIRKSWGQHLERKKELFWRICFMAPHRHLNNAALTSCLLSSLWWQVNIVIACTSSLFMTQTCRQNFWMCCALSVLSISKFDLRATRKTNVTWNRFIFNFNRLFASNTNTKRGRRTDRSCPRYFCSEHCTWGKHYSHGVGVTSFEFKDLYQPSGRRSVPRNISVCIFFSWLWICDMFSNSSNSTLQTAQPDCVLAARSIIFSHFERSERVCSLFPGVNLHSKTCSII